MTDPRSDLTSHAPFPSCQLPLSKRLAGVTGRGSWGISYETCLVLAISVRSLAAWPCLETVDKSRWLASMWRLQRHDVAGVIESAMAKFESKDPFTSQLLDLVHMFLTYLLRTGVDL